MGPGMFDGMVTALLLVGAAIGLAAAGFIWLLVYVCNHLSIGWA